MQNYATPPLTTIPFYNEKSVCRIIRNGYEKHLGTIKYMTNGKILVKKGNEIYDMLGKKVK